MVDLRAGAKEGRNLLGWLLMCSHMEVILWRQTHKGQAICQSQAFGLYCPGVETVWWKLIF